MKIPGETPGGSTSRPKMWIVRPIDIKGMSVLRTDKMIEVFDNTTGTLFDKITVDVNREGILGSYVAPENVRRTIAG